MVEYGVPAVPHEHPKLGDWRNNFRGVRVAHEASGFEVFGAIDDLWRHVDTDEFIVVDYKATSKNSEVTIDAPWQITYKRQMEFYQWLLRQRGYQVSNTGYFVYANGVRHNSTFDNHLEFTVKVIPYTGHDGWVESTLIEARLTLSAEQPPRPSGKCEYCMYVEEASSQIRTADQSSNIRA